MDDRSKPRVDFRAGSGADVQRVARAVVDGFDGYRSFAPARWAPPTVETEAGLLRGLLGDEQVWCLLAEAGGDLVGHIVLLPAARAYRPVDDPELAHLRNLFVRSDFWGSGLARTLHRAGMDAACERGFAEMRLFAPASQARARRFYERRTG